MRKVVSLALIVFLVESMACEDFPEVLKVEDELRDMYRGQRAWEEYRQANCELMSDRAGEPAREPLARCLASMARERTAELRLLSY